MSFSDVEAREKLHVACQANDVAYVAQLFTDHELAADDATDALKNTISINEPSLVKVPLQNGADVSVFRMRDIPLSRRANELLKLLARYKYDFNTDGHRIFQDFSHDQATLDWLLDQGVDINRTDTRRLDDGSSLAMGESDYSLHLLNRVAADGNIDLFDHLVTRGADASLSTALHSASKCEDHEMSRAMVRRLLDKYHMDINRNNEDFRDFFRDADDKGSPLCSAILHRNLTVVHELLQRGASPIEPDKYPISYAVMLDGFLPALKPLFSAGADPTVALKQASSFRNFEAARMCLDNGADPVPALQNALERYERKTKSIAEDKAGNASSSVPHHEEYQGMSARTKAEMRDRKAMIEWLRRAAESHLTSDTAGS